MKRKTGDRAGWPRIVSQQYTQQIIRDDTFTGYVTLLKFKEVMYPLTAKFTEKPICLVENGSYMMQHIPFSENYALTTFISPEKEITQWYFDMIDSVGVENDIPYFDDLYLDLILVPNGELIDKDIDELEEALAVGSINKAQYEKAWATFKQLKKSIQANDFPLLNACRQHFEQVVQIVETK